MAEISDFFDKFKFWGEGFAMDLGMWILEQSALVVCGLMVISV